MKPIIAIDYGDKNIGVAVSCPSQIMAYGVGTIRRDSPQSFKKPILEIRNFMRQYDAGTILLGLPKNMDGSNGARYEITLDFKERLSRNFKSSEIILWDERLSSQASKQAMRSIGVKSKKIKEIIDEASAIYILQGYLDYKSKNNRPEGV